MVDDTHKDDWGTSAGLPEDLEGTIAEAWFGPQPEAEGEWADRRYLFFHLINVESDDLDDDEWTARFTIGNGWVEMDGGAKVVRDDDKKTKFNNNTDYGRFINRVLGQGKEGKEFAEAFDGCFEVLKERGSQYEAGVWEGLRFRFKAEEYSATIGDEEVTWTRLMPVEFLGAEGGDSKPKSGGGKDSSNETESTLKELAKDADDHATFMAAALKVDGVKEDSALMSKVLDDGDGGFYATHG